MGQVNTVVPSAARIASGNSGNIDLDGAYINVLVDVTAVTGTSPTLDLSVEWSHDGTTFAAKDGTADALAQITATGTKVERFACMGTSYRLVWTIGGTDTPTFTFSVTSLDSSA